jgi:HlyD family type I secretion membrane fusion protein
MTTAPAEGRLYDPLPEVRGAALFAGAFAAACLALGILVTLPVAVVAPGKLIAEGQRRPVQHLEGGIVREVLVREGDRVNAGQPLLRLEDTRTRADRDALDERRVYIAAVEQRLAAAESLSSALRFDPAFEAGARAAGRVTMLDAQRALFESSRRTLDERRNGLDAEARQLNRQAEALAGQAAAIARQIVLTRQELGDYRRLVEQGYGLKVRVIDLERRIEGLAAEQAEATAAELAAHARLRQIAGERAQATQTYVENASAKRAETRSQLAEIEQRLRVAADTLERGEVRAPVAGVVQGLKSLSPGAVVAPGEPVMEIVPSEERLVAELNVEPGDIDRVRPGQDAFVRVFSRVRGDTRELDGAVTLVSPDRFEDKATGRPHYAVRVVLTARADEANVSLRPGMSVEGHVVTGHRSPVGLLLQPLIDEVTRTSRQH